MPLFSIRKPAPAQVAPTRPLSSLSSFSTLERSVAARPPRTLRERAERFLLDAGVVVKPALYLLPITVPAVGAWQQTPFRFPRPEGPVVVCGLARTGFSGAVHGLIRLTAGTRRYLDEVDMAAVMSESFDDATDWPRPIIVAPGEVLTAELQFTVDDGSPGDRGYLSVVAFHTDQRGADLLVQHGELWAISLLLTSTSDEALAEDSYTAPAGAKIDLDALLNADDGGRSTDVDLLEVIVGNVDSLTPTPRLVHTRLEAVASTDDRASIVGLELRPGEQLTVRQSLSGLGPGSTLPQRYTFLGRRVRDGISV